MQHSPSTTGGGGESVDRSSIKSPSVEMFDAVGEDEEMHQQRETPDEEEPLHILDYTCANLWEKTVTQLETFVDDWTPASPSRNKAAASNTGVVRSLTICDDGGNEFLVEHHVYAESENLFEQHPIVEYFGTLEFLLVKPEATMMPMPSDSSSLLSVLVSGCGRKAPIPCFVVTGDVRKQTFEGLSVSDSLVTRYSSDVDTCVPPQCQYLQGVLDLFQLNLGLQSRVGVEGILADVTYSYEADGYQRMAWEQLVTQENDRASADTSLPSAVPWGTTEDPVASLYLDVSWHNVSEGEVMDTAVTPGFDALNSQNAVRTVRLLGRSTYEFSCISSEAIADVARLYLGYLEGGDDSKPRLDPEVIDHFVATTMVPTDPVDLDTVHKELVGMHLQRSVLWEYPPGTMTAVFAHNCTHIHAAADVQALWDELCALLQKKYDSDQLLTVLRVFDGHPSLDSNLINQKLQLLRCCCVKQCSGNEASVSTSPHKHSGEAENSVWGNIDLDEMEDLEKSSESPPPEIVGAGAAPQPRKTDKLLLRSGERMVIPDTQESVPLTTDVIDKKSRELMKLGTTSTAQAARGALQVEHLWSDMCAFQHANKSKERDVTFSDFVNWHSPRDFIPPTTYPSHAPESEFLSARMSEPGNLWRLTWEKARPAPISEQPQLFFPPQEASLVLRWLKDADTQDILRVVVNSVISSLLYQYLHLECVRSLPCLLAEVKELIKVLSTITPQWSDPHDPESLHPVYKSICDKIARVESLIAVGAGLLSRFTSYTNDDHSRDIAVKLVDRLVGEGAIAGKAVVMTHKEWELTKSSWVSAGNNRFAPQHRTFVLSCLAERPMLAKPTFQRFFCHSAGTDLFRAAMSLSSEQM